MRKDGDSNRKPMTRWKQVLLVGVLDGSPPCSQQQASGQ